MRAARRREALEALRFLVHDPALISRTMVEEFLRYKRLDGVAQALETIAHAWFPQGRQAVDVSGSLRALRMPVQVIWGSDDRIVPAAHAQVAQPAAHVHVLNDVGHLPHMEKAGEVNRLLRAMLG
jgi:pyruvate dehydrogenase E2 component (dihydrolipoamide acetyltransferase)